VPELVELTDESWSLFERLFRPGEVPGGWRCAFFRMAGPDYRQADAAAHKAHVRAEVVARRRGLVDVSGKRPSSDLNHGTVRTFAGAGFTLVDRRGRHRALTRLDFPVGR
jgi:hypothetical protein